MNRGRPRQQTASRTMILLDPDLDQPVGPLAKKALSSPESRKAERDARLPSVRTLNRFQREAQAAVRLKGAVSVLLTTDEKIKTLNRDFRRKNKATDVLSFPAAGISRGEVAGDLAISVETALRQSREHGHPLATEVKVLILHGLLHLAGYDHETDQGQMAKKEQVLRARLKLPSGLIERTTTSAERRKTARSAVSSTGGPRGALKGHGFSRAEDRPKTKRASASEGHKTPPSTTAQPAPKKARSAVGPTAGGE